jgi:outer membrane protein OmpA-like peptidoglycan-associated protein
MTKCLWSLICLFVLVSCGTQKRMTAAKKSLEQYNQNKVQELSRLDSLKTLVDQKERKGHLADTLGNQSEVLIKRLEAAIESEKQEAEYITQSLTDKKTFRKAYKSEIHPRLIELDTFNNRIGKREQVYQMLTDAINITSYNLFSLAAFFDPGVYRVAPENMDKVQKLFSPVIDSIAGFSNKYKNIPHKAIIVLLGYADELGIPETTSLYKDLVGMIKNPAPTQAELNKQLSEFRAKELLRNLKFQMTQNAGRFNNYNNLKIGYVANGRGEEYPFAHITDYRPDDDRRRIVLCYWLILPEIKEK